MSTVVPTGKFDATDAKFADRYAEEIHRLGIHLTMIGIQPSVDVNILKRVADYAFVVDVNEEMPANIQDLISQAYGCVVFEDEINVLLANLLFLCSTSP